MIQLRNSERFVYYCIYFFADKQTLTTTPDTLDLKMISEISGIDKDNKELKKILKSLKDNGIISSKRVQSYRNGRNVASSTYTILKDMVHPSINIIDKNLFLDKNVDWKLRCFFLDILPFFDLDDFKTGVSYATISDYIGAVRQTVSRNIKKLIEIGYLNIHREFFLKINKSSVSINNNYFYSIDDIKNEEYIFGKSSFNRGDILNFHEKINKLPESISEVYIDDTCNIVDTTGNNYPIEEELKYLQALCDYLRKENKKKDEENLRLKEKISNLETELEKYQSLHEESQEDEINQPYLD